MHRLIYFVVLCACASLSVSHVLIHTTNDLVDTASGLFSDAASEESDVTITHTLDVIVEYTSTSSLSVLSVKRYRRSVIATSNCPTGLVKLWHRCVLCSIYEDETGENCPLKK